MGNKIVYEENDIEIARQKFLEFVETITGLEPSGIEKMWLDNQDVCKLLNISKRTLQYLRSTGKIPFSMVGNKCFYKVKDIDTIILTDKIKIR